MSTTKLLKHVFTAVPPSKAKSQVFVTVAPGLENAMIKEFTSILGRGILLIKRKLYYLSSGF